LFYFYPDVFRSEDYPKGECRIHACMDMTEPKGRGVSPIL